MWLGCVVLHSLHKHRLQCGDLLVQTVPQTSLFHCRFTLHLPRCKCFIASQHAESAILIYHFVCLSVCPSRRGICLNECRYRQMSNFWPSGRHHSSPSAVKKINHTAGTLDTRGVRKICDFLPGDTRFVGTTPLRHFWLLSFVVIIFTASVTIVGMVRRS